LAEYIPCEHDQRGGTGDPGMNGPIVVQICVGSSCYVRGADRVIDLLRRLCEQRTLTSRVELRGSFCMDHCGEGVTVRIGDDYADVTPETAERFLDEVVIPQLKTGE
jgi:NADH:ubiquinone oxidoreductase subunit E